LEVTPADAFADNCVVEASAGTGKTSALVKRFVEVAGAGTPVDRIVAVTFTHAAAGSMKLRVRQELERHGLHEQARQLDRAFIGTIHAFCAQLLRRRPVEARIDPLFQELAQPDALRVFARVFRQWIERRLAAPSPALERAFAHLSRNEDPLHDLRRSAWNLAEWRDFDARWTAPPNFDREGQLLALAGKAATVADLRRRTLKPSDRRFLDSRPLADFVDRARHYDANRIEGELLALPREMRWLKWDPWTGLKEEIEQFGEIAGADLAASLRDELWEVVKLYQDEKRRAGQVDFADLLLYARDLLERVDLRPMYDYIFVDEFQDTDPMQAAILRRIAQRLFVVGDPKQSIYRFRRADARLYRRIQTELCDAGAQRDHLTTSTRSTRVIQSFVNAAFAPQIEEYLALEGGVEPPPLQPGIVALPMPEPYGSRNLSGARILECSPNAVAAFIEWLVRESGWLVRDRSTGEWRPVVDGDVCILFRRFTNWGRDLTQEYVRCLEARGIAHLLVGSKSFHQREEVNTLRAALRAVEWPDDELSVFAVLRGGLIAVPDDTLLKFRQAHGRFRPFKELPEDLDPEFAPIRDGLSLIARLHRKRNYRPLADTIHELLEETRAHAGFAFRKGGERVLANVYRLADLARAFEAGGAATSFRAFVEYLDSEYEGSDMGEAPVLEQEGGGVQLMTVHRAKGLEFPVVILADLTAKLTHEGADRYSDSDKGLCAQRLIGCAPWELLQHAAEEEREDREEAVRIAYVAATRARDLLVVAAVGEKPHEGGWLEPLYDALYPPEDRFRISGVAPGCPKFGNSTVLNRPPEMQEETSVKPGLHTPRTGTHQLVWFDPAALRLKVGKTEGVESEQVLQGTPDQAVAGLERYQAWRTQRSARLEAGAAPRLLVTTAERLRRCEDAADLEVITVTLECPAGRPGGRRFGRIVHDILEAAAGGSSIDALAEVCGRGQGATEAECSAAAEVVRAALAHPLLRMDGAVEIHREWPMTVKLSDGRIVDGRIDLAWWDGGRWTVVDYKTNRPERRNVAQVQAYGVAVRRATGMPVRCVVLEV
jgi:ATP-dependent exoDNAse (exonuclease V) beta subunit